MMIESALSYDRGAIEPVLVKDNTNDGSLSIRCFSTTSLALTPFSILMPHIFLADVAAMYSGLWPKTSKQIQLTVPLNEDRVDKVFADEKPVLNDCSDFSM